MLSEDELKQISDIMERQLKPIKDDIEEIKEDIEGIKGDIEELKEHAEVTRYAANAAVEWIDTYYRDERPIPIEKTTK